MVSKIEKGIAKLLPAGIRKKVIQNYLNDNKASLSYSNEGEDMVLAKFFFGQKNGFYVDIGAHHPSRFSNTRHFYDMGWKGINIDAQPGSMLLFNKERARDINLEIPVAEKEEDLVYYIFNEPALNGFSKEISEQRDGINAWKIVKEINLRTLPLSAILDRHLPPGQPIDFLTIDVEGLDLSVLKSNNWDKFRPSIVVVEDLKNLPLAEISDGEVYNYLKSKGYYLAAKSFYTLIFCENLFK